MRLSLLQLWSPSSRNRVHPAFHSSHKMRAWLGSTLSNLVLGLHKTSTLGVFKNQRKGHLKTGKKYWKDQKNQEKMVATEEFSQLPICLFWRRLHNLLQSDFADYSADGLESRYILVVWKSPKNCQKYQNKLESSATKCCIL